MLHKRTDGGDRVLYHSGLQALDDAARGIRRHVLTNDKLRAKAYSLYGQFAPQVPTGMQVWGAKGELDVARIRRLAKT